MGKKNERKEPLKGYEEMIDEGNEDSSLEKEVILLDL